MAAPALADSSADSVADLKADIDTLLDGPELEGGTSGVVVRSLDNDEVLYERNGETPLVPASNTKLLTSAAALDVLGPGYTFRTTVSAGEDPGDGVVKGNLYLQGTGDPTLTADAYDAIAAKVAKSGVKKVTGNLVADDTWFDDQRLGKDWDPTDEPYYYAAQISALTVAANTDYDTGVVKTIATPGGTAGAKVKASIDPAAANLKVANKGTTGAAGSETTLDVTRASGTNTFAFAGSLPAGGAAFDDLRTVHEPTDHAANLFAKALKKKGVAVAGTVKRGTAPKTADRVTAHKSMPLEKLLVPFMKLSNNGHAEILVKAIGRKATGKGTWDAGLVEVEAAVNRLGVKTDGVELFDGSGLSNTDHVPADTIDALLSEVPDEPWFDAWKTSLPLAGKSDRLVGGTLASRMVGTAAEGKVHAKTGSLTGASALSGYVTTADGEELLFSILNNKYKGAPPRGVQDAIAIRLAEFSRSETTETAPRAVPLRKSGDGYTGDLECSWAKAC